MAAPEPAAPPSVAAPAKPDFAARKAAAGRYLEIMGIDRTMRVMMRSMLSSDSVAADMHLSDAQKQEVLELVLDAVDAVMPRYIDRVTDLYAEIYTLEELQALADFYGSPTGRGLIAKQQQSALRANELIDWLTPQLELEMRRITRERGDRPADRQS